MCTVYITISVTSIVPCILALGYASLHILSPGPKHKNWEGCSRKDIQHKDTLGCTAGLTLTLIYVAAGLLVVIQ